MNGPRKFNTYFPFSFWNLKTKNEKGIYLLSANLKTKKEKTVYTQTRPRCTDCLCLLRYTAVKVHGESSTSWSYTTNVILPLRLSCRPDCPVWQLLDQTGDGDTTEPCVVWYHRLVRSSLFFSQIMDGALCRAFKVQREWVSESTTGYTVTSCGVFYYPWHRHQIEGTIGF